MRVNSTLLIGALSATKGLLPTLNSTGQTTCAELQELLGVKVTSGISPSFIESTSHYYSQQQAANKPACAVTPSVYSDVRTAMRTIRKYNATMAVKAGGHNPNNYWSSVKGGVLIDLKNLNAISYDPAAQTGYYQPGNRWKQVYEYFSQFDVIALGGRLASVGSGVALDGGLSFLSAQYGLVCDGFRALDVVLADGSLVTATKTNKYSDLFYALKGGGNQFGIVVGYTVDVHPIGDFWGGLLVYEADQADAVHEAALNFTNANTDSKAAILGTYNKIPAPTALQRIAPGLSNLPTKNLDAFILLMNVYDGPNGRGAFEQFEKIPHLLDTRKRQSYTSIANILDFGTLSTGTVAFRAATHPSLGAGAVKTLKEALANFEAVTSQLEGTDDFISLDFQPVPASLVEASRARGKNALQSPDGPYVWINYIFSYIPGTPGVDAALAEYKASAEKTPSLDGYPLFLNDGNADQPILRSYGGFNKLKATKAKYDPTNFLATNMGGPSFD